MRRKEKVFIGHHSHLGVLKSLSGYEARRRHASSAPRGKHQLEWIMLFLLKFKGEKKKESWWDVDGNFELLTNEQFWVHFCDSFIGNSLF